MGMWDELKKAQKQPPTNVVNADILVVETIDGGEPKVMTSTIPLPSGQRIKFKPVDPSLVTPMPVEKVKEPDHPSNHFDLVGDDMGASPEQRASVARQGRPRLHPSNAAKQQAYRDRKKGG